MINPRKMPEKIWAKTHGASTDVVSGQRGLIGGWSEHQREGQTEYIRLDVHAWFITKAEAEFEHLRGIEEQDDEAYSSGFDAGFGEARLTQDITENMLRKKVADLTTERDAALTQLAAAMRTV